jgi:hypothetical protein
MSLPSLVLVLVMAVAGCGGTPPATPESAAPVGTGGSGQGEAVELELRFDETVTFEELAMRWLEIQDSRCPTGVQCIWAGQVVVTLEAVRGEDDPVKVELVLRIGDEPKAVRVSDYELRLQGVDPHPKEGVTPERSDYVARIEIAEL